MGGSSCFGHWREANKTAAMLGGGGIASVPFKKKMQSKSGWEFRHPLRVQSVSYSEWYSQQDSLQDWV